MDCLIQLRLFRLLKLIQNIAKPHRIYFFIVKWLQYYYINELNRVYLQFKFLFKKMICKILKLFPNFLNYRISSQYD